VADRTPFGVVGVQQRLVGLAAGNEGELPARVPGVLDAGVHALGAGRAVDVGGVAGQEHQAGPVAGGVAVLEAEVGQPDGVAESQPAPGEGIGERLQLLQGGPGLSVLVRWL
jgi:hypothetical protein